MEFAKKLEKMLSHYQLSGYAFGKKTGIDSGAITDYLKGTSKPTYKAIRSIALNCPEISAEWLLRDQGEMLLENFTSESVEVKGVEYNFDHPDIISVNNSGANLKGSRMSIGDNKNVSSTNSVDPTVNALLEQNSKLISILQEAFIKNMLGK